MVSKAAGGMKKKQKQKQEVVHEPSSAVLSGCHLARAELLKRRMERLRLLAKCYRELQWALLERLKAHFRHYLWHFGLTPFRQRQRQRQHLLQLQEGSGENSSNHSAPSADEYYSCAFLGCKLKAMPFTTFCHLHILSDSRQKLYTPCSYVIKSAQAGPIKCGKPILRSSVPCLCVVHSHKAHKHLTRTFKRAGLNNVSSSNHKAPTPKLHLIVTEYVGQIQAERRRRVGSSLGLSGMNHPRQSRE